MNYQCKNCKQWLDKKEYHYKQFESLNVKKQCWDCEKAELRANIINDELKKRSVAEGEVLRLKHRVRQLENITKVINVTSEKTEVRVKHKHLNVYMIEGNKDDAWLFHKNTYRKYRTYPNQFKEDDSVLIINKPDGSKKYYSLNMLYKWIFIEKEVEEAPF
jgi:hypothetical protein